MSECGIAGPLLVVTPLGRHELAGDDGRRWTLGRGDDVDVQVPGDVVSRMHGSLRRTAGGWEYEDATSHNGSYVGGSRIDRANVPPQGLDVRLGAPDGPLLRLTRADGGEADADAVVRIGRASDGNDLVLDDLLVSRSHAVLERSGGRSVLRDLGSHNGTLVDGVPVARAVLTPGAQVVVGATRFVFDGSALVALADGGLEAHGLDVVVDGAHLLHDVSFAVEPRTLLAVVGPSGAGKSTLLGALTGQRPATRGRVVHGGLDVYANLEALRARIGTVPQQDILHTALTVRQALSFGADLRSAPDTTADERAARVREVAAELGLTDRLDTRIARLSGGERKRASTALELLTRPELLFLDEPTSGLDTDLDREVMQLLRGLADGGRTVVVVTHNLEHLDVCDQVLVLGRGGHLVYLGTPAGVFAWFGVSTWADVFRALKAEDAAARAARWRAVHPPPPPPAAARPGAAADRGVPAPRPPVDGRRQLLTLVRRALAVTAADRPLLLLLVALPVLLAVIARVVPGDHGLATVPGNGDARQLLLVLAVGACLMGSAGSVRELVKEREIYRRERAVGMVRTTYLGSKVVVLGSTAAVQGVVLTLLALAGRPGPTDAALLPGGAAEVVAVVAITTVASAAIGLLLSALVRDESQAMPLLVLLTMAQLVLCGALVPIAGRVPLEQVALLLPARWAFAAAAATVDLGAMSPGAAPDRLWAHGAWTWLLDVTALVAIGAVAIAGVALLLRRLDPAPPPTVTTPDLPGEAP